MMDEKIIAFKSDFKASHYGTKLLRVGNIIDSNELPHQMVERVVHTLSSIETVFNTPMHEIQKFAHELGHLFDEKYCIMSTPVLTNAGRYKNKPLSACTVPPINMLQDMNNIKKMVDQCHQDGMGTGFNLDETEDPIHLLQFLNAIAVEGALSGKEDRPVGNIGILSIHHPKIYDFMYVKTHANHDKQDWKFNISINISKEFMQAVEAQKDYTLNNNATHNAAEMLTSIAECAHACGDPGLIFIERLNQDNPTPGIGNYVSVAPCAEVGLAPGEACQFGYINLARCIKQNGKIYDIDYAKLEHITHSMTRALDNALEISIERYAFEENKRIMSAKRKIGLGVCGVADFLIICGLPYNSSKARTKITDILAFINYHSKIASHNLAQKRGSCGAMALSKGCRYKDTPGFLETKYGTFTTEQITATMWLELDQTIKKTNLMRNMSTIALPPTGRSSLIIDASTGIEPLFSLITTNGSVYPHLEDTLRKNGLWSPEIEASIKQHGKIGHIKTIPESIRSLYVTALEINPIDHLTMISELQKAIDESISKTINMPESATVDEIRLMYHAAYTLGLKGITIYRDGCRKAQPKQLAH